MPLLVVRPGAPNVASGSSGSQTPRSWTNWLIWRPQERRRTMPSSRCRVRKTSTKVRTHPMVLICRRLMNSAPKLEEVVQLNVGGLLIKSLHDHSFHVEVGLAPLHSQSQKGFVQVPMPFACPCSWVRVSVQLKCLWDDHGCALVGETNLLGFGWWFQRKIDQRLLVLREKKRLFSPEKHIVSGWVWGKMILPIQQKLSCYFHVYQ